jgi:hypothetical protein
LYQIGLVLRGNLELKNEKSGFCAPPHQLKQPIVREGVIVQKTCHHLSAIERRSCSCANPRFVRIR